MSKKSRRRNRKILGALALLGTGLALANRGKGTEMSNVSVDSGRGGSSASAKARAAANKMPSEVYDDAIMRGVKGVKPAKVFPRLKVTDRGNVIKDGVDTGIGNPKTKFVSGKNIFIGGKPFTKATLKAQREIDRGMLPPQLRVPKAPRALDPMEQFVMDNPLDVSAKDGGRIVKGKKTAVRKVGIAKRGFGRAMKKRSK